MNFAGMELPGNTTVQELVNMLSRRSEFENEIEGFKITAIKRDDQREELLTAEAILNSLI